MNIKINRLDKPPTHEEKKVAIVVIQAIDNTLIRCTDEGLQNVTVGELAQLIEDLISKKTREVIIKP